MDVPFDTKSPQFPSQNQAILSYNYSQQVCFLKVSSDSEFSSFTSTSSDVAS